MILSSEAFSSVDFGVLFKIVGVKYWSREDGEDSQIVGKKRVTRPSFLTGLLFSRVCLQ